MYLLARRYATTQNRARLNTRTPTHDRSAESARAVRARSCRAASAGRTAAVLGCSSWSASSGQGGARRRYWSRYRRSAWHRGRSRCERRGSQPRVGQRRNRGRRCAGRSTARTRLRHGCLRAYSLSNSTVGVRGRRTLRSPANSTPSIFRVSASAAAGRGSGGSAADRR